MESFKIFWVLVAFGFGFKFRIDPEQRFCFNEDLLSQTLTVVEASSHGKIELKIDDPSDFPLYHQTSESHLYSWAAFDSGIYSCCITNKETFEVTANFIFNRGVKAKDYSGLASLRGLKDIEVKLKKLEDLTKDIHKKIQYLREREENMRNTNSTIHNRVILYSILTLTILLALVILQIMYFKRFFRLKKLI